MAKTTIYLTRQEVKKAANGSEIYLKDARTGEIKPLIITHLGTGFVVSHRQRLFLVTAKHVAKFMDEQSEMCWNTKNNAFQKKRLGDLKNEVSPHARWFYHSSTDLAVHPFGLSEDADQASINEQTFITDNVAIGSKIYVLGFPLGLGTKNKLSPLSKKTELSSWKTSVDVPGISPDVDFILLDDALAQGYSGAPVFLSAEPVLDRNKITIKANAGGLIGVLSGAISDQTGGKISYVVPIAYLTEIFQSTEFQEYANETGMPPE